MATSGVALTPLASSARVRRVTIWGPPASNLVPVMISLEFPNSGVSASSQNSADLRLTDTSMGSNEPAYITKKPPPNSMASQWVGPTTTALNLFSISGVINTIIDTELELILNDTTTPNAAVTVTSATASVLYTQPLDGVAAANLSPMGFNFTV